MMVTTTSKMEEYVGLGRRKKKFEIERKVAL